MSPSIVLFLGKDDTPGLVMTGGYYHANLLVTVAVVASMTHQRCCAAGESDAGVRVAGTAQTWEGGGVGKESIKMD